MIARATAFEVAIVYEDAPLVVRCDLKSSEMSPQMVAHEEMRRQEFRVPTFIPKRALRRDEFPSRCGDAWPPMFA